MEARLVLLLPRVDGRKRSRGSVYTVAVREADGQTERNLYVEFLRKANAWDHERREPQLLELLRLFEQVYERGPGELGARRGSGLRSEGKAFGLPLARYEGWEDALPPELRERAAQLTGLDALRLYCYVVGDNLILFGGNVKRTAQVYEPDSNVLAEFNQANRLAVAIEALARAGRLRNAGKTGRIDLGHLGWFGVENREQ